MTILMQTLDNCTALIRSLQYTENSTSSAMTEIDDPVAIWAQLKALQEQVQEQNKKLAKTQLDLELSKEREQILKEQTQFDDKEAAQVEMMAQLKVLVTKVDEQEVKIEDNTDKKPELSMGTTGYGSYWLLSKSK